MSEFKDAHLTRQLDIIPMSSLDTPVWIIGCGAIGSFVALQLAKMGLWDLHFVDPDTVSIENMSCQFFRHSDIGKPKVSALRELLFDFTVDFEASLHYQKWGKDLPMRGIVIAAVDDMAVRKHIFDHCTTDFRITHFIDPRMGAETALMYVMKPQERRDRETYAKTIYTDAEAIQERCTAKSTIYTANLLSGLVVKAVKDIITKSDSYPRVAQWAIGLDEQKIFRGGSGVRP